MATQASPGPDPEDFLIISTLRRDPALSSVRENDRYSGLAHHLDANESQKSRSSSSSSSSEYYMLTHHRDRMLAAAEAFGWPAAATDVLRGQMGMHTILRVLDEHFSETAKSESGSGSGPKEEDSSTFRIRLQLSRSGELSFVSAPVPALPSLLSSSSPSSVFYPASLTPCPNSPTARDQYPAPFSSTWTFYLEKEKEQPKPKTQMKSTEHTAHKTTLRTHYDAARASMPPDAQVPTSEPILRNESGEVTEGTLATLYFWRPVPVPASASGGSSSFVGDRNGEEGENDGGKARERNKEAKEEEYGWTTPRAAAGGNRGTTRRWALENGIAVEGVVRWDGVREGEVVWASNGVRGFGWGVVVSF